MKLERPAALLLFLLASTAAFSPLRAEDLPRANAMEEAAVRALLGKKAIITGKVTDAFESPKGMTFLNLEGGKFTIVAWKESYEKFEGGSPAKLYKGKTIEATGEVFEFRPKSASKDDPGKLEIKLTSPDQIKVLTTDAAPEEPKKEAPPHKDEKKKGGTGKPETEKPGTEKPDRVDAKKFFK